MDIVAPESASRLRPFMQHPSFRYVWKSLEDTISGDLEDYDAVAILSAQSDVPLSFTSPRYTFEINAMAPISILEAAAKLQNRGPKLLYMSTENVYGMVPPERLPVKEDEPFRPVDLYGASKASADILFQAYAKAYGLRTLIIRSTTIFGEGSRPRQVIPIFIHQAVTNRPLTIEGDGSQTRDFCYVGNTIDGITKALESGLDHGIWNIGSGEETSIRELAEKIISATGSLSKIENRPWRQGEKGLRLSVSIERARRELKYVPRFTMEQGLKRTIASLKDTA